MQTKGISNSWTQQLVASLPDDGSPRTALLRTALTQPISTEDADEIRRMIAKYFGRKLSEEFGKSMDERGVTTEMLGKVATGELSLDELP